MAKTERSQTSGTRSKRPHLTPQQCTEIQKLSREGYSISAIARQVKCHRQTVKMHLAEQKGDTISDEARAKILAEGYRKHFENLVVFSQANLKSNFDASPPDYIKRDTGEKRKPGPIFIGGLLGLPNIGDANFMSAQWVRMYLSLPKDVHMLQALREHTSNFLVWEYFDKWRKLVVDYGTASSKLLQFLEDKIESDLYQYIKLDKVEEIRTWLFGNVLLLSVGMQKEDVSAFRKNIFDPKGVIVERDESEDKDGSAHLYDQLISLLEEIQKLPDFKHLKSAAATLMGREIQLELKHIAKKIDHELAAIELLYAFPGRCQLCPV